MAVVQERWYRFEVDLSKSNEIDFKDLLKLTAPTIKGKEKKDEKSGSESAAEDPDLTQVEPEPARGPPSPVRRPDFIDHLVARYVNGGVTLSRAGNGEDNDAEVANSDALNASGKRTRQDDDEDYESDFIDDSELVETLIAQQMSSKVKTKHGGFFVSGGDFETTTVDAASSDDDMEITASTKPGTQLPAISRKKSSKASTATSQQVQQPPAKKEGGGGARSPAPQSPIVILDVGVARAAYDEKSASFTRALDAYIATAPLVSPPASQGDAASADANGSRLKWPNPLREEFLATVSAAEAWIRAVRCSKGKDGADAPANAAKGGTLRQAALVEVLSLIPASCGATQADLSKLHSLEKKRQASKLRKAVDDGNVADSSGAVSPTVSTSTRPRKQQKVDSSSDTATQSTLSSAVLAMNEAAAMVETEAHSEVAAMEVDTVHTLEVDVVVEQTAGRIVYELVGPIAGTRFEEPPPFNAADFEKRPTSQSP